MKQTTIEEDNNMVPHGSAERELLERFVVENVDLLSLESRIERFNIFDALGVTRAEIRHSNFLAFILDPAESHGLGQLFLKAVLMDLLKNAPPDLRPVSPIDLDGTDLRGVEVKREWKNIDLLITCKEPRFVVVVENKVDSRDYSGQLDNYARTIHEHRPDDRPLYVYLTPNGDDPSEETKETWLPYRYKDIYRVLKRIRDTYKKTIGDDVLVFLDHYLKLLGSRFMNDVKLDELCQRIYKNHRQALELIYQRGRPASGVLAEAANVLKEDHRCHVVLQQRNLVDFVPTTWREWLPSIGTEYKDQRDWIIFRFLLVDGKLDFYAEVQKTSDLALAMRKQIAEFLIAEAPFRFNRRRGGNVTDTYTQVSGIEHILEWGEDEEPESEAIRVAVRKTLDDLYPRLEKIAFGLKPLCKLPTATT